MHEVLGQIILLHDSWASIAVEHYDPGRTVIGAGVLAPRARAALRHADGLLAVKGLLARAQRHAVRAEPVGDTVRRELADRLPSRAVGVAAKADAGHPVLERGAGAVGLTLEFGKVVDGITPGPGGW